MKFSRKRQDNAQLDFIIDVQVPPKGDPSYLALTFEKERQLNAQIELKPADSEPVALFISGRAKLQALNAIGEIVTGIALTGHAVVTDMQLESVVNYDVNVERGGRGSVSNGFRHGIQLAQVIEPVAGNMQRESVCRQVGIYGAKKLDHMFIISHDSLASIARNILFSVKDAYKTQILQEQSARFLPRLTGGQWFGIDSYEALVAQHGFGVLMPVAAAESLSTLFEHAASYSLTLRAPFYNRGYYYSHSVESSLGNAGNVIHGERPIVIKPPIIQPPTRPPLKLDFRTLRLSDAQLEFVRVELDALIVMNKIKCAIVNKQTNAKHEINPVAASLNLDIESCAWLLSGELVGDEGSLLAVQNEIEMEVNGHVWRFFVSSFERSISSITDTKYRFLAEGRSKYLGEPYAPKQTGTVDQPISPWQIVEEQIQPTGFTLDRSNMPDWILSSGSYSYNSKSPLALLNDVVAASGGMIKPDRINDALTVEPRYKRNPDEYSTLADEQCDHVIDISHIISESRSDQSTPVVDSLFVVSDTTGTTTELLKSGTVGANRGADVISPLQQDHAVNRDLGRRIMNESGSQELVRIRVPLGNSLIEPGMIVRFGDTTGLCISTGISVNGLTDVWQDVSLEVHH